MPALMISSTSSRLEAITVQLLIICLFTLREEINYIKLLCSINTIEYL